MKRIIGIGNRYVAGDAAGPLVCDWLAAHHVPADVEVVDGGLQGLNLLRLFDDAERVILIDAMDGFGPPGSVMIVNGEDPRLSVTPTFGHHAGAAHLLRMLAASTANPPRVDIVGVEGAPTPETIAKAGRLALAIAAGGEDLGGAV